MTSPAVQLERRLSDALGTHDVHPEDRIKVQEAYVAAGVDTATWDELPAEIRQLVEELERLPRQSWDDPADVPDELPD